MKKLLIACIALSTALPAMAADLAVKAPVYKAPPPAPVYGWTGFYIGVDAGGAWAKGAGNINPIPDPVVWNLTPDVFDLRASSALAGVHVGYNLQFAPRWVAGIEADWTSMNTDGRLTSNWIDNTGVMVQNAFTTLSSELQWAASVRGRIGYLFVPSFLTYATGGVAWGKWEYGANSADPAIGYAASTAFSRTEIGWVAGIGFE